MGISSTGVGAGGVGARKRVLIVDDQRTFADLLRLALAASVDLDCEGVASGPEEAIALVRRRPPDLVIMDLHFATSTVDGIDATAEIKRMSPGTQVVVLTGHADRTVLSRAAEAGACSLIPKDGSLPELMKAIRSAAPGAMLVHPRLLRTLMMTERAETPQQPRLSQRELDVVGMLALGMDTRTISEHLGISLHTCRGYVKSLFTKLDAHSQLEAVATARRQGLLDARTAAQG
jgi:DNA-binding NarL/FixJ family response regulator